MTLTHGRQRGSQVPARNAANLKAQWRLAYIYEHGELGLEVESAKALEYLFKNQKSKIKIKNQKSNQMDEQGIDTFYPTSGSSSCGAMLER